MKRMRILMFLAIVALLEGCAHVPSWVLRTHVEGYNRLHPETPIAVEEVGR